MKSIAEILKSKGITEATKFHNYEYLYEMVKVCCDEYAGQFSKPDVSGAVLPKKCEKCGGDIKRKYPYRCPTNGIMYCEKCIDPEGKIYNDRYFGKTDR